MRTWTNIAKKICELVPTSANFDAASAVIFVAFIFGVVTALEHTQPSLVERMVLSSYQPPVYQKLFYATTGTSARGAIRLKRSELNDVLVSAITLAQPVPVTVFNFAGSNGNQSTKSLTSDINSSGHRIGPFDSKSSGGIGALTSIPLRIIA